MQTNVNEQQATLHLQVELANDSAFGLGAYCFSGSQARAERIGRRIKSGMFVANDYASNGMCQSLPFGGVKESGFDRYAFQSFLAFAAQRLQAWCKVSVL